MPTPKPYKLLNARQASLARFKDGTFTIKIQFPFTPEDVANVKTLPGRLFYPSKKFWTATLSNQAIKSLQEWGFIVDQRLIKHLRSQNKYPALPAEYGLKKALFKYQETGVSFIEYRKGRALVADEQGLGKTIQAIAWMTLHPEISPVIIIVPAAVKHNWRKEILAWTDTHPDEIAILSGVTPYPVAESVIIINYDIIFGWLNFLLGLSPKLIIADEIQMVKSNKAKRTKAVKKLVKHVPHFIGLSGTPIVNRPIEFFNAIQMVDKTVMPSWPHFTRRYCNPKHNGFGWNYNGSSNTDELNEILTDTIMIRRLKKDVLTDLPDKIRSFFPIEMDPALLVDYEEAENNFLVWLEKTQGKDAAERASGAQALTEMEVLKQVAVAAKLPNAIKWIENFLDSGEKLVVFCTHKFVVDALMKAFGKVAVKLDGRTTGPDRQLSVDKFQGKREISRKRANNQVEITYEDIPIQEQPQLFVGNIKAAGVGITLTAASNVAFLELPWTPGDMVQAEDRCHRIGQKDTVNIYYLLAEFTIEEKIAKLLDDKRKVLDSVLDGKETEDSNLIMELIENY